MQANDHDDTHSKKETFKTVSEYTFIINYVPTFSQLTDRFGTPPGDDS